MAYCPNCKLNFPDGTRFCGNCGAPLTNINPPVQNRRAQPVQNRMTQPVNMQTPSESKPKGVPVDTSRRTIKALLCIPVALAIIIGVIIFFKIDLKNMNGYVQLIAVKLADYRIKGKLQITLGRIAVYGLALMIILSAYMLPARLSKMILKTVTITDRVIVFGAGYFIIAFIIWFKMTFFDEKALSKSFSIIFHQGGGAAIKEIILLIIMLALMLVAILICIRASLYIIVVITENLKINGPVLGIIGSAYELLSSIFATALVLCAVTVGLSIIMIPFVLGTAAMSGKRVIRDEDGNLYTVS